MRRARIAVRGGAKAVKQEKKSDDEVAGVTPSPNLFLDNSTIGLGFVFF